MKNMNLLHLCLLFCLHIFGNLALNPEDVVFVILSQDNPYHIQLAENTRNTIQSEAKNLGSKKFPVIHLTHADFSIVGDWTIFPLLPTLESLHSHNSSWIIFVEDLTEIRLEKLLTILKQYDENQDIWLGHALHDEEATIIHHFAFYQDPKSFKYPNAASGIAFTTKLLKSISDRIKQNPPNTDFSIDKSHELSKYIWNEGKGVNLTHEPSFCIYDSDDCTTFPRPFKACDETPIPIDSIYFVVKTCSKFHTERIPIVRKTWGKEAVYIDYFSDVEDSSIPTIDLGISNTERGHCAKTLEILKHADRRARRDHDVKWVVLADDDTIFSIPRLQKFLTCYDPTSLVVIGERYGYSVLSNEGYNYVTAGGGIVFSKELVGKLSQPGNCECPGLSTPDDMFLGVCLSHFNTSLVHSPYFHQARPADYAAHYLSWQTLISFHKHWMIDPIKVYDEWLSEDEINRHEEL